MTVHARARVMLLAAVARLGAGMWFVLSEQRERLLRGHEQTAGRRRTS
jgi:hypothetical protein